MDDREGRREAEQRNLLVVGTLRVLADASGHDLLDLRVALGRLRQTNFRASERLMQWLLEQDAARRAT
jgi:predicted nucleic acid-binding protein